MVWLVAGIVMAGAISADADDKAVVEKLKQVAKVYVGHGVGAQERRVVRLDLRITGERDAKELTAALKELARLPHLETLLLVGPAFTDDAAKELAQAKSLKDLQLHRTKISDAGIKALSGLPNLRRFVFWGSGLTDKGAKDVAQMRGLQQLEITDAPITDEGLKELAALCELQRLAIINSQASEAGLKRLFESLPQVEPRKPAAFSNK